MWLSVLIRVNSCNTSIRNLSFWYSVKDLIVGVIEVKKAVSSSVSALFVLSWSTSNNFSSHDVCSHAFFCCNLGWVGWVGCGGRMSVFFSLLVNLLLNLLYFRLLSSYLIYYNTFLIDSHLLVGSRRRTSYLFVGLIPTLAQVASV